MKIIIGTEQEIAQKAAQRYAELLAKKPAAVLGYATGSTPLGLYAELVRLNQAGAIDYKDVTTFNLDEYAGLDGTHDQSYRYFMDKNLFEHINIDRARTHVPSGLDIAAAADYDRQIEAAGGIDLQLLGIGNNGHIGFNEPNSAADSRTHRVTLTENTIEANARFFESADDVPRHAVTMGLGTILDARRILLLATGAEKFDALHKLLAGKFDSTCPATVLLRHENVTILCDRAAFEGV